MICTDPIDIATPNISKKIRLM